MDRWRLPAASTPVSRCDQWRFYSISWFFLFLNVVSSHLLKSIDVMCLQVYDLKNGKLLRQLDGHFSYVNAVALSDDGQTGALSGYTYIRTFVRCQCFFAEILTVVVIYKISVIVDV